MKKHYNYVTNLDIKYNHLELIDIPQLVRECKDKWFKQFYPAYRFLGTSLF